MTNSTRYPSLRHKGVFITGGATGIGAAMVAAFLEQGCEVAFIDVDDEASARLCDSVAPELQEKLWFRVVDVTDIDALQTAVADADAAFGALHVLVNNVANDARHDVATVSPQSWSQCMAVNLDATFFASQAVHRSMATRQSGSIINLSSINALLGPSNMPGYVTAKAGIIGMSKALARDFGVDGIRVNAVLPGWVVTERQLQTWLTPEAEQAWMEQVAIKKRIQPADVANLVLFLASEDSALITGQSLTVDGGRT